MMIILYVACIVLAIVVFWGAWNTDRIWPTVLRCLISSALLAFGFIGFRDECLNAFGPQPSTVSVYFLESDKYVEYKNARYYSDPGKIVLEDGSTIYITNAEVICD